MFQTGTRSLSCPRFWLLAAECRRRMRSGRTKSCEWQSLQLSSSHVGHCDSFVLAHPRSICSLSSVPCQGCRHPHPKNSREKRRFDVPAKSKLPPPLRLRTTVLQSTSGTRRLTTEYSRRECGERGMYAWATRPTYVACLFSLLLPPGRVFAKTAPRPAPKPSDECWEGLRTEFPVIPSVSGYLAIRSGCATCRCPSDRERMGSAPKKD